MSNKVKPELVDKAMPLQSVVKPAIDEEPKRRTTLFASLFGFQTPQKEPKETLKIPNSTKRSLTDKIENTYTLKKSEIQAFDEFSVFLKPNPRSIQRINKLYTFVRTLLPDEPPLFTAPKFTRKLLAWIIICEQWPMRACWIVQLLEDSTQADAEFMVRYRDKSLSEVFRDGLMGIMYSVKARDIPYALNMRYQKAVTLDYDVELFEKLLKLSQITVGDVGVEGAGGADGAGEAAATLLHFTVNMNPALRDLVEQIQSHREEVEQERRIVTKKYRRVSLAHALRRSEEGNTPSTGRSKKRRDRKERGRPSQEASAAEADGAEQHEEEGASRREEQGKEAKGGSLLNDDDEAEAVETPLRVKSVGINSVDHIGVSRHALGLARLVVKKPDESAVYGIYGPWGRGKSFLMEQTKARIQGVVMTQVIDESLRRRQDLQRNDGQPYTEPEKEALEEVRDDMIDEVFEVVTGHHHPVTGEDLEDCYDPDESLDDMYDAVRGVEEIEEFVWWMELLYGMLLVFVPFVVRPVMFWTIWLPAWLVTGFLDKALGILGIVTYRLVKMPPPHWFRANVNTAWSHTLKVLSGSRMYTPELIKRANLPTNPIKDRRWFQSKSKTNKKRKLDGELQFNVTRQKMRMFMEWAFHDGEHPPEDGTFEWDEEEGEERGYSDVVEYEFVTFDAWLHSGSESVWAGLVKSIYSQVEKHYGSSYAFAESRAHFIVSVLKIMFGLLVCMGFFALSADNLRGLEEQWEDGDTYTMWATNPATTVLPLVAAFGSASKVYHTIMGGGASLSAASVRLAEEAESDLFRRKLGYMEVIKAKIKELSKLMDDPASVPTFLDYLPFPKPLSAIVSWLSGGRLSRKAANNYFRSNRQKRKARLVIFVENLDRCPPAKCVEVLQSLVLLTEETKFVIFLAIDPRIVVPAIEMDNSGFYDGAGINGYDYLAKIVSFPFSFPVMRDEEKKMLCRGFSVGRGDFFKTEWMDWKDKINDKMNRIERVKKRWNGVDEWKTSEAVERKRVDESEAALSKLDLDSTEALWPICYAIEERVDDDCEPCYKLFLVDELTHKKQEPGIDIDKDKIKLGGEPGGCIGWLNKEGKTISISKMLHFSKQQKEEGWLCEGEERVRYVATSAEYNVLARVLENRYDIDMKRKDKEIPMKIPMRRVYYEEYGHCVWVAAEVQPSDGESGAEMEEEKEEGGGD